MSMSNEIERPEFDDLYRDDSVVDGLPALTPWDIGGPQSVVKQLVAYGAVRGEVLDPGTGGASRNLLRAQGICGHRH